MGVPGKVVEILEPSRWAVVEIPGVRRRVGTALVGEVRLGEYLMIHAGYAIEKLDAEQAAQSLELWEAMAGAGDPGQV